MEIITDKIVFGGNSIAKFNGKNIFIPYAIPGEKIEIQITEQKRDYDNAIITKIIEPSPYRVKPECKYYEKCGGCNLMHIDSEYQKTIRKEILNDIFAQNGINLNDNIQIISGPFNNYRCRFQLNNGGLSQKASNEIISIDECLCAENCINDYLKNTPFDQRAKGRTHLFGSSFVNTEETKVKVASECQKEQKNFVANKTRKKIKIKENHYFAGTVLSPENVVTVELNGKLLSFDIRGFFQSNLFVFEKVLQLICQNLDGGKNVLDMYSGCGSISAYLADIFECVTLVEHNRDALVFAEKNLSGKKHVSYGMSGEAFIKNCVAYCPPFDAVVIDPPRSGMEKSVRDYLCKNKIKKICSLSCDPATHARDCKELIASGYKLTKMYLLDFYPNTSHIESLAIFES